MDAGLDTGPNCPSRVFAGKVAQDTRLFFWERAGGRKQLGIEMSNIKNRLKGIYP
jgi:hypothetical protein